MNFWGKVWQLVSDNRYAVAIGLALSIFMAIWTVGTDIFTLFRPGPVTETEENTERTAVAAEEIAETLRSGVDSPRQRLASSGYELSEESFRQAIQIGDVEAVEDFCSLPGISLISGGGFFATRNERPVATLELLQECPAFDTETECVWDEVFPNPSMYRLDEVEIVCGRRARASFENRATQAQTDLRQERIDTCLAARDEVDDVYDLPIIDARYFGLMAPLSFTEGCRLLDIDLLQNR